jgi:hypothetical protein
METTKIIHPSILVLSFAHGANFSATHLRKTQMKVPGRIHERTRVISRADEFACMEFPTGVKRPPFRDNFI